MPTKRAWVLGVAALIFYFLANQTQVGWLYIFTNGLLGFLIAAFLYGLAPGVARPGGWRG
jgi:hypothetical protein